VQLVACDRFIKEFDDGGGGGGGDVVSAVQMGLAEQ